MKRKKNNLSARIKTLTKKAYELEKHDNIKVALIIIKNDCFIIYRSVDHEFWPLSMKQIVSLYRSQAYYSYWFEVENLIPHF